MSNRKSRRYREKKPMSTVSVTYGIVGCVSFLFFCFTILFSVASSSDVPNVMSGISVILMIVSMVVFVLAWRQHNNENFNKASRVFGVVGAVIGAIPWILLYITGILVG